MVTVRPQHSSEMGSPWLSRRVNTGMLFIISNRDFFLRKEWNSPPGISWGFIAIISNHVRLELSANYLHNIHSHSALSSGSTNSRMCLNGDMWI